LVYWIVFASFVLLCITIALLTYVKIRSSQRGKGIKDDISTFNIASDKTAGNINIILVICLIGGVISGMLGVGGGIVMTPLMLELGVLPKVASSSANFLLFFTSVASSLLYILSGQIIWDYALVYTVLCTIASVVGSIYVAEYIKMTRKTYVLIFTLFYLMLASLVILPINGIKRVYYDVNRGIDIFQFHPFC
jgi:uncharacterized membrane protein YfcA